MTAWFLKVGGRADAAPQGKLPFLCKWPLAQLKTLQFLPDLYSANDLATPYSGSLTTLKIRFFCK